MDRATLKQFSDLITGRRPKEPYEVTPEIIVIRWHVAEPRRDGQHYQFNTTVVEYGKRRYTLTNPALTHCDAIYYGGKMRLPLTYDQMVAAYLRAKELGAE